jgi:hypothetical protein
LTKTWFLGWRHDFWKALFQVGNSKFGREFGGSSPTFVHEIRGNPLELPKPRPDIQCNTLITGH